MALFLRGLTAGGPGLTWKAAPPDPGAETKLFTGEQSNTNLQIGPDHLLKIYRKLVAGPGLDGEVLGALSGSGVTPALIGLWRADDLDLDLGLCCQRIKDGQDGWDWARAASRASRPVGPQLAQLGQALRRLHQLLAQAFPTDRLDAAEVGRRIRWRFDLAAAELPEVAALRLGLERVLGRLDPEAVPVQRLHGDFHLGQALISPDGWTIIDFEGEPLKTPAERRGLDSPWRDVAGLLRSIDYARRSHSEPDSTVAVAWAADARRGFLEGYLGPAGAPPPLLAAYEADKAVYELVYETRNRPGWADLPRRALAGLLG
ncbi:MAG: phosphotransferase [Propionibacteriaceae bacterium]|nr:phosphotransferase [Propionibacteriaceae bacterium]